MGKLSDAIKTWIRAEYHFRYGPHAYSRSAQDSLIKAEEGLCEVVTGETNPVKAVQVLGIKVEEPKKKRERVKVEPEVGQRVRVKVENLLPKSPAKPRGLFDD